MIHWNFFRKFCRQLRQTYLVTRRMQSTRLFQMYDLQRSYIHHATDETSVKCPMDQKKLKLKNDIYTRNRLLRKRKTLTKTLFRQFLLHHIFYILIRIQQYNTEMVYEYLHMNVIVYSIIWVLQDWWKRFAANSCSITENRNLL